MRKTTPGAWSWILYDWANSAYALNILVAIYPFFFSQYFASDISDARSTYWFGFAASMASLLAAVSAPILGTVADLGGSRKRLLGFFTFVGSLATAGFFLVGKGAWESACAIYILATLSFSCANLLYDSLLASVSTAANRHKISGIGFSMGYLGSVLLLCALLLVIMNPEKFGFANAVLPTRIGFLATAAWWLLFSIPLFINVKDPKNAKVHDFGNALKGTFRQLWATIQEIRLYPAAGWFLVGYWFYIDGVNTIIKMAGKLGADLGIEQGQLIGAIILVQFIGVPCAFLFGWLGQRFGPRCMLFIAILIYLGVTCYAAFMTPEPVAIGAIAIPPVYILGFLIGCVQGGIQSLSRSLFIALVPESRVTSFFGFYNIVGKSASVLGPYSVGTIAYFTGDTQTGILFLAVFFIIGALCLLKVPAQYPEQSPFDGENNSLV